MRISASITLNWPSQTQKTLGPLSAQEDHLPSLSWEDLKRVSSVRCWILYRYSYVVWHLLTNSFPNGLGNVMKRELTMYHVFTLPLLNDNISALECLNFDHLVPHPIAWMASYPWASSGLHPDLQVKPRWPTIALHFCSAFVRPQHWHSANISLIDLPRSITHTQDHESVALWCIPLQLGRKQ